MGFVTKLCFCGLHIVHIECIAMYSILVEVCLHFSWEIKV